MKELKEYLNESSQINESFLSVGATIIVAVFLAKMALKGVAGIAKIFDAVKEGITQAKEYNEAIKNLDALLQPHKDELMKKEYAKKLFTKDGLVTAKSVAEKGFAIVYCNLEDDIKSVLSDDDFKKYKSIIDQIYDVEHDKTMRQFR